MQSLEFRKPIYPDNKQIETVANGLKESLTTFKVIKLAAKNNFLEVLYQL